MESITVDQAQSVIRADYWEDVSNVVTDIQDEIKNGQITDDESLTEWLEETVDGHSRVIYTGQAILGLFASSNDSAYEEETGERGTFEQKMYYAFLADIREELDRAGVTISGQFVGPEDVTHECGECGEDVPCFDPDTCPGGQHEVSAHDCEAARDSYEG